MHNTYFYLSDHSGKTILAFGIEHEFVVEEIAQFSELQSYLNNHKGFHQFVFLSYELKNATENLSSNNKPLAHTPLAYFMRPRYVVELSENGNKYLQGIPSNESESFIDSFKTNLAHQVNHRAYQKLNPQISKENYIEKVERLKGLIQQGEIYEVTFCQLFEASVQIEEPLSLFGNLHKASMAPFSCYIKFNDDHLLCMSPERFIKKEGTKIYAQPIKGSSKRSSNKTEDEILRTNLLNSEKERSENVMIVDLVRNDLSKIARPNSVNVDELFGIYSFPGVHQMISTISAEVKDEVNFTEIINALFPMGSMTGAPKMRAMQIIDSFEEFQRGWFSGSVGYISPNGDFDFNVVIRSLIYDAKNQKLSCPVGSAITINSDAESEYLECEFKIQNIRNVLNSTSDEN